MTRPQMCSALMAEVLITDSQGRVAILRRHDRPTYELPSRPVPATETPRQAAAALLSTTLTLPPDLIGRLVAVDSQTTHEHVLNVHLHTAQPLPPQDARVLEEVSSQHATTLVWMHPEEAQRKLPAILGRRLCSALKARATGRVAHLEEGWPQVGSPVGLPPERRAQLESTNSLSKPDFTAHRPTIWVQVGLLITDARGQILLVVPSYTDRLLMPGGGVDADTGETPRQAAEREWQEELGIPASVGSPLATDWIPHPHIPRISYIYDGGTLSQESLNRIRLPHPELIAWRLLPPDELGGHMPDRVADRLHTCLALRGTGRGAAELVNGRPSTP